MSSIFLPIPSIENREHGSFVSTYTDFTRLNQFALCKPLVRCAFRNVSFNCSQNTQHLAAPLMSIRIAQYEDMKYMFLNTRTRRYEKKSHDISILSYEI